MFFFRRYELSYERPGSLDERLPNKGKQMKRQFWLFAITFLAVFALSGCGQEESTSNSDACGTVSIARMNWQSAEVLAEIDSFILENGYDCEVEIVAGDSMPTLTSMVEKAQPDIAPEMWSNAVREPLEQAITEGRMYSLTKSLPDGGIEGWWIPKYLADANPDIKTIDDALARPDLFPSAENPNLGAVHNCPAGWGCQLSTQSAFRAWGAEEKGFELIDTGSAAGLDGSIAKAYEREQGWLGYYWSPTSILGKYEMVKLDAGVPVDEEGFNSCNAKPADECANPIKTDWPSAEVFTVVTSDFKERAPEEVTAYLSERGWSNATANELMAWMSDNQATGEDGAIEFLKNNQELWTKWVSAEAAEKIKAAL